MPIPGWILIISFVSVVLNLITSFSILTLMILGVIEFAGPPAFLFVWLLVTIIVAVIGICWLIIGAFQDGE